jgi:DNA-binding winged helix-turn-helix (wHTH) protein/tetratricopeptide (TPR) repeat protein
MPTEEELQRGFTLGDWEILPDEGVIRSGDVEVHPEPQTWRVLLVFAKNGGKLVTKEDLIAEVWGGRAVADDPINRAIREVRKSLGDSAHNPKYVATLHKRGYRLLLPVNLKEPEPSTPVTIESGPSLLLWKTVAAILVIGFVAIMAYLFMNVGVEEEKPLARSIAVMPFENLSGDQSDEYLVLGFKGELVQMLGGLDDYKVMSIGFPYVLESDEIADKFGVSNVLFGSLQRSGDVLKIYYRISTSGEVVHVGEVEGDVGELFALQESLALMVRDNLVGKSTQTLIKSRPSDSEAYDSYMRGVYALEHRTDGDNLEKAIELFQNAIRLDKDYGPPYLALATLYTLLPNYRNAPLVEMDSLALQTISAGIAADPNLEDAGSFIWGYVYHKEKRWNEAEEAYQRAINADVVDSNAFNWYSRMLASVGRLDSSLEQALAGLEIDPGSPTLNSRVAMSYAWLHEKELALEYFERANDLGWKGSTHVLGYAFILMQTGQFEKAQKIATDAVRSEDRTSSWVAPVFAAFTDPTKVRAAIEALDEAAAVQQVSPLVDLTVRGILGDVDGAMRIAKLLENPGEAFEMDLLFIPELAGLRQHPDFMPLMDRLGITDYWYNNGCVWGGDRVSCPKN